jgi:hypothetical protein
MENHQSNKLKQNKRLIIMIIAVFILLFVPLIAMLFTNEVNWTPFDFLIAGILLISVGLIFELILRKVKTVRNRIVLSAILFLLLFLVWAELAVGIFGTPFAGS